MKAWPKSSGFALLLALWTAAILALMTIGVLSQFSVNTEATRVDIVRTKHALLHATGIRLAALNIASSRTSVAVSGAPSSTLGMTLDAGRIEIVIENEAARLDLRYLAPDALPKLLAELGVRSTSAARIEQRLRLLSRQEKPITYRVLREWLKSSPGAYQKLLTKVSLHNGGASVHPLLASEAVLESLPGLAVADRQRLLSERAHSISRRLESPKGGRQANAFALVSTPVNHPLLDSRLSAYYRITVTSWVGDSLRSSSDVIKMTNSEGTLFDWVARL